MLKQESEIDNLLNKIKQSAKALENLSKSSTEFRKKQQELQYFLFIYAEQKIKAQSKQPSPQLIQEEILKLAKTIESTEQQKATPAEPELSAAGALGMAGTVIGSIHSLWTNGIGITNLATGAVKGGVLGALTGHALSHSGFWARSGAVVGAVGSLFKTGGSLSSGAAIGMFGGTIIDGLGAWGNTGLVAGMLGGLLASGFALEAIALAALYGAAAGSVIDTASLYKEYREASNSPRPA